MRCAVRLRRRFDSGRAGEDVLLDEDLAAVLVAYSWAEWLGAAPEGSAYTPKRKAVVIGLELEGVKPEDQRGETVGLIPNFEEEAAARKLVRRKVPNG